MRIGTAGAMALIIALGCRAASVPAARVDLTLEMAPTFQGAALVFDSLTNRTAANQLISITRLDFLLSNFALQREDRTWLEFENLQAFIGARDGRTNCTLPNVLPGRYQTIRFLVGVTPELNHRDPAGYPASHPLNPIVNGLHWGWQSGYVFLALEGDWLDGATQRGFSFHIANDPQLMTVELPALIELPRDQTLRLALDVARIFDGSHHIVLNRETNSTHSSTNDPLASLLCRNTENAFGVVSRAPVRNVVSGTSPAKPLLALGATPYRFSFSSTFPRPALPLDNPLTDQGVTLGRALFHDPRLSINNQQSCASCHRLAAAGSDQGKEFSLGAEGNPGDRNAMPLFNLAWKASYFWDGRAVSLRQQALEPIQNPIEMHETLTNVVKKLQSAVGEAPNRSSLVTEPASPGANDLTAIGEHGGDLVFGSWATEPGAYYGTLFERAFGTPEITSDRIARALEQFLLTQVAGDSKFDRARNGEAQLTQQEQRGFELFVTEYDPRREQFGADCFHCHGGPLFQSAAFANNGLDARSHDQGRFQATRREGDQGKFAVPSLRNVAVTGPYMHDGRFKTLEEAVEHYRSGVKRNPTLDPNLAKHPDGGIPFSEADKQALVAFLKTLTDERLVPTSNRLAEAQ